MDEPDYLNEEEERAKRTLIAINKSLALLFVFAIYLIIFLKIIILK